ncbi:MAG: hypothetical protein M3347_16915 [Armatimonadota bacterium]|nr:hypothetical protein [Armatimonadota bacterium]
MKVRWTQTSVRLRITPSELEALQRGASVSEKLAFDIPGRWLAAICPGGSKTTLTFESGQLHVWLADADCQRLAAPENEGVYFELGGDPPFRYYIEKDFPCIHPRAADAQEPSSETFAPLPGFTERKR